MRVEISYKRKGDLLTRTLIREFDASLSELEFRSAVIGEILSDMGIVSYEFSYERSGENR